MSIVPNEADIASDAVYRQWLKESEAWRDLITKIALKVNCLPSVSPFDNEHVLQAISDLEEIAKLASQVSVDWEADDNEVIFSLDELKQKLRPWRESRNARAKWERQHSNPSEGKP